MNLIHIPGDIPDVLIRTSYVKAFKSYHLTDRKTDRQTRLKLYTIPLHKRSMMTQYK